jgi:serine/threonine protein kinase
MLGGDLRCELAPYFPLLSSHPTLSVHLERMGRFSEETVRFYIAELSSALSFLHDKRIVHRDLKPDNILLDEAGHAHITDFNIAVHYSERRMLTSVAGSMAYMGEWISNLASALASPPPASTRNSCQEGLLLHNRLVVSRSLCL